MMPECVCVCVCEGIPANQASSLVPGSRARWQRPAHVTNTERQEEKNIFEAGEFEN